MLNLGKLISNSTFKINEEFKQLKPELSIIFIHSINNKSLLINSVDSILKQDFTNFELLIIGDKKCCEDFQLIKKDPRIGIIQHRENIDLPAASMIEGYLKSRGNKLLFTNSNNIFDKKGIKYLMEDQLNNPDHLITYGSCSIKNIFKKQSFDYKFLQINNFIDNGSIILDRRVIEDIGCHDPHVAMVDHFEWDFWLRVGKKYDFFQIPYPIITNKKSKRSYELTRDVFLEWIGRFRLPELRPKNILDYPVNQLPSYLSNFSYYSIAEMVNKRWFPNSQYQIRFSGDPKNSGHLLFICSMNFASLQLAFEAMDQQITYVDSQTFYENPFKFLLGIRGIIFCRSISDKRNLNIIKILRLYGIPYYFFIDDNLFIIEEYKNDFQEDSLKLIRQANAVIVTSDPLVKYIKNNYNTQCIKLNCVYTYYLRDSFIRNVDHFDNMKTIRIAYASIFKLDGLNFFVEGLKDIIKQTGKKIEIYAFSLPYTEQQIKNIFNDIPNMSVHFIPAQDDYDRACHLLREKQPHFLIHPKSNQWANIYQYKTLNMLITASFLNAIPLITKRPPYDLFCDNKLIGEFIFDDIKNICKNINTYINGGSTKALESLNNIHQFITDNYSYESNQHTLELLLKNKEPLSFKDFFEKMPSNIFKLPYKFSFKNTIKTILYKLGLLNFVKSLIIRIKGYFI